MNTENVRNDGQGDRRVSTEKSPATTGQASASSPTKRRVLVGILLVVALGVAAWFLTSSLRTGGTDQASTTTPADMTSTTASETPTTGPEATASTEPTPESTSEAAAAPTTQAPAPDTNTTEPSEPVTQAPAPKTDPTQDTEASPSNTASVNRAPQPGSAPLIQQLPAPASGGQTLVEGFPTTIIGPVDGTTVTQNTVSVEGSTMLVSLTGRTSASPEEISRHYEELWASLGLSPQPGSDDNALSATSDFEWASLTFNPSAEGGNEYTVDGFFLTN
jgi:hypothetical protein